MEFEYNQTSRTALLVTGIISMITVIAYFVVGCIILVKGLKRTKFTRAIAGLLFFGNLTYTIGHLVLSYQSKYRPSTPSYIILGCQIGLGIIFGFISYYFEFLGTFSLGAVCGWTLWSLFSDIVLSRLINFIVGIILTIIGIALIFYFKAKGQIVATFWLGSYLIVSGIMFIIMYIINFSGNYDALLSATLPILILNMIITVLLFGISSYRYFKNSVHGKVPEMEF